MVVRCSSAAHRRRQQSSPDVQTTEHAMTQETTVHEIDAINQVLQGYIEGARTGKGAVMQSTFHEGATIYGYVGTDLFGGPIQGLYDWNDQNGPARSVQIRVTSVDVVGTSASVRLDVDDWTGHRFTDFMNLVKFDGQWKVVSKVFYLHP
jgi:hypothetical protein